MCVCVLGAAPLRQHAAGTTLNCGFQLRSPGPAGCGRVGAGRTACQTHTEGPLRGWQLSPQTPLCFLWPCLPPLVWEGPPGSGDSLYVVGSGTEWSDPRYCLLVAEGAQSLDLLEVTAGTARGQGAGQLGCAGMCPDVGTTAAAQQLKKLGLNPEKGRLKPWNVCLRCLKPGLRGRAGPSAGISRRQDPPQKPGQLCSVTCISQAVSGVGRSASLGRSSQGR